MSLKESAVIGLDYPIQDAKFIDNKTILTVGGGGEGNNGVPNKITAVRCSFKAKDPNRRLQKFREITLPSNEDSPQCLDIANISGDEENKFSVFIGCNQSSQLIKSMNINNNLRKYVFTNDEHLRFLDAAQLDQNQSGDPDDYPKVIRLSQNNTKGCFMTAAFPSMIYIFNPDTLDLNFRYKPSVDVEIKDFCLSPDDDGKVLCYITANSIETVSTVTGNSISSSNNENDNKKQLSSFYLSKVKFIDNENVLITATSRKDKSISIFQYSITDMKLVKQQVISKKFNAVVALDFSKHQDLICIAGNDFSVSLIRLSNLKTIKVFKKLHSFAITSVAFSPNGSKLATCSAAKTLKVFKVPVNYSKSKSTIGTIFQYLITIFFVGVLSVLIQKGYENGQLFEVYEMSKYYGKVGFDFTSKYGQIGISMMREKLQRENIEGTEESRQYFQVTEWDVTTPENGANVETGTILTESEKKQAPISSQFQDDIKSKVHLNHEDKNDRTKKEGAEKTSSTRLLSTKKGGSSEVNTNKDLTKDVTASSVTSTFIPRKTSINNKVKSNKSKNVKKKHSNKHSKEGIQSITAPATTTLNVVESIISPEIDSLSSKVRTGEKTKEDPVRDEALHNVMYGDINEPIEINGQINATEEGKSNNESYIENIVEKPRINHNMEEGVIKDKHEFIDNAVFPNDTQEEILKEVPSSDIPDASEVESIVNDIEVDDGQDVDNFQNNETQDEVAEKKIEGHQTVQPNEDRANVVQSEIGQLKKDDDELEVEDKDKIEDIQSEETQLEDTQPEETQPEDDQLEDDQPEETQLEEDQPEDDQPEDDQPEDDQPEDNQPEETQLEDTQPEDTQPEETQPEDDQVEDDQPEETQLEDDQPEDDQLEDDQPEDDQPEDDQLEEDKLEEDKLEEDQPEETQPEDDQPEETQIEDDQPEDDQPEDVQSEDVEPENAQPEVVQLVEDQLEDIQPEEVQSEDIQSEDISLEDAQLKVDHEGEAEVSQPLDSQFEGAQHLDKQPEDVQVDADQLGVGNDKPESPQVSGRFSTQSDSKLSDESKLKKESVKMTQMQKNKNKKSRTKSPRVLSFSSPSIDHVNDFVSELPIETGTKLTGSVNKGIVEGDENADENAVIYNHNLNEFVDNIVGVDKSILLETNAAKETSGEDNKKLLNNKSKNVPTESNVNSRSSKPSKESKKDYHDEL